MKNIYFDNAATSFPKAPLVAESISNFLINIGANINRGTYDSSYAAADTVYETRELICSLFGSSQPTNVVFSKNVTESLNILIKGCLKSGDHVLISSLEHNAVMRPLNSLQKRGVEYTRIRCDEQGVLDPADVAVHIKPHTKAVIMTHASNVCGTILPLQKIGKLCKENGLTFIIDAAQTAGFLDIDLQEYQADALAFTGHKGLLGPQGIGGMLLNDRLAQQLEPFIEGGTGSISDSEEQPSYLPDKFEAGTLNIPGIYGLNAALKYIQSTGLANIREEELRLTKTFIEGIQNLDGPALCGLPNTTGRTALVSLDFTRLQLDNAEVATLLAREFHIATRCGLHCSPSAHKTLGTFPQGTIRFSFSHSNTKNEIEYALNAISKICKGY